MFKLKEQFASLRAKVELKAPPVVDRRGKARRIQLRVADELLLQLAVIKIAEGGSSNKFCEAAIAEAAARRIEALQKQFSIETWDTIVGAAHAHWRQGLDS
ncbi:MAG TPA: hypothetical protein VEA77_07210 [Hyphomicrobium sp.]|nr:hypothetical protein [Hyphomicrobium sp.]